MTNFMNHCRLWPTAISKRNSISCPVPTHSYRGTASNTPIKEDVIIFFLSRMESQACVLFVFFDSFSDRTNSFCTSSYADRKLVRNPKSKVNWILTNLAGPTAQINTLVESDPFLCERNELRCPKTLYYIVVIYQNVQCHAFSFSPTKASLYLKGIFAGINFRELFLQIFRGN